MKNHRLARVSEAIREVASEAILFELRDPRIKFTTVTRAEVSADLQRAKVYVSVMGSDKDRKTTLTGLYNAAGFVQSRLADRMKTRFIPVLEFILDEGMKNSMEVSRLLSLEKKHDTDEHPADEHPAEESDDELDDDEDEDEDEDELDDDEDESEDPADKEPNDSKKPAG